MNIIEFLSQVARSEKPEHAAVRQAARDWLDANRAFSRTCASVKDSGVELPGTEGLSFEDALVEMVEADEKVEAAVRAYLAQPSVALEKTIVDAVELARVLRRPWTRLASNAHKLG